MRQQNAVRPGNDDPTISPSHHRPRIASDKSISSSFKPRWLHWHEPGTSRVYKKLIFKLDWFLLSFSCLYFFIKQLDGNNISNAYVFGMKEELGFGPGNELSWMNTYFSIGQSVCGPLSNLPLTVIAPGSSSLAVWWRGLCSCFSFSHSIRPRSSTDWDSELDSSSQPHGLVYSMSWAAGIASQKWHVVWGLFVMSGMLGQIFSGYLQPALFSGMEDKGGTSSWRWLFIFDFLLAVLVAIYGIIFYPDTAENTSAFYLSESERERARARIDEKRRTPVGKLDGTVSKRILISWQQYTVSLGYAL